MSDEMEAEFDTSPSGPPRSPSISAPTTTCRPAVAAAAARPPALVDRPAGLAAADRMLDCGAGVGGPAAFAAAEVGVRPMLSEPEAGACRAARRLFGLPVVQAGSDLPFAPARSTSPGVSACCAP